MEVPDGWMFGIHDDDRDTSRATFLQAHETRTAYKAEYRVRRADGQYRWVHDHGSPWFDADGTFMGHMGCCVDITDQRTRQWTAANAERRLKTLVENTQDVVYRVRLVPSLAFEYVGGAIEALTGYTADELYTDVSLALQCIHPRRPLRSWRSPPDAAAHLRSTVTYRWLHRGRPDNLGRALPDAGVRCGRTRSSVSRASRAMSRHGSTASESSVSPKSSCDSSLPACRPRARKNGPRCRANSHDELGQTLTALKLEISRAVGRVRFARRRSVTTVDRLQSVVGLVDVGIATVKRISARLRPATLDSPGPRRSHPLGGHDVQGANRHPVPGAAPIATRIAAQRQNSGRRCSGYVQEALNNVVCHANASSVQITITKMDDSVELRIRDNGRGITAAQATAPGSIGLLGMKERAALVGGTFKVSGQRGKGTVVSVHVPSSCQQAVNRPRGQAEPKLG